MDQATALSLLRHALTAGGAYLVTSGAINAEQLQVIIGAIVAVAPVIWAVLQKRQQHAAVITAAATGEATQATVSSPLTSPHA